jgi:hypothetical protein
VANNSLFQGIGFLYPGGEKSRMDDGNTGKKITAMADSDDSGRTCMGRKDSMARERGWIDAEGSLDVDAHSHKT